MRRDPLTAFHPRRPSILFGSLRLDLSRHTTGYSRHLPGGICLTSPVFLSWLSANDELRLEIDP